MPTKRKICYAYSQLVPLMMGSQHSSDDCFTTVKNSMKTN